MNGYEWGVFGNYYLLVLKSENRFFLKLVFA